MTYKMMILNKSVFPIKPVRVTYNLQRTEINFWLTVFPHKKAKNQIKQEANSQTSSQTNYGRRRTGLDHKEIVWNEKNTE